MTKTARYIQVDDSNEGLQRTKNFPKSAPVLGTDANGNPVNGIDNGLFNNKVDITWEKSSDGKSLESTVYQLTGVGSSLVAKSVKYSDGTSAIHTSGNGISTNFAYGRACDFGSIYKKVGTTKVKVPAWLAQSSNGAIFISTDRFKTVVKDTSLSGFSMGSYGAQCLVYAKINLTTSNHSWICFPSGSGKVYYIEDIPANYNDDGTFVSANWVECNPGLSRIEYASHVVNVPSGGFLYTSWGLHGVMHVTDLVNGVGVNATINTSEEISGIATDSYGTYYVVSRNNGKIYKNISSKTSSFSNASSAWSQVTNALDGLTVDGNKVDNLPCSGPSNADGLNQTWWAGLGCAYGLWVCTVANKAHASDPTYAYSDNGVEWYTYGANKDLPITTWDMKSDGSHWFACPTGPSDSLVYQVLINSIPAHKRLIAEKGLMVAGEAFFQDVANANYLCTDVNGKLTGKALPPGYEFIGTDENGNFIGAGLSSPFSQELFPFTMWQDRIVLFSNIGANHTCAFPFIANRSQSISKIKVAVGQSGQNLRLGLVDGGTNKVIALTEEKTPVATGSTFINNYSINKSVSEVSQSQIEIVGGKLYYLLISAQSGPSDQTQFFCVNTNNARTDSPVPCKTEVNYMTDSWVGGSGNIGSSNMPSGGIPYRPWISFE